MWNGSGELSCDHGRYKSRLLVCGQRLEMGVMCTAVIFSVVATAIMMIIMACVHGMMPRQDITGRRIYTSRLSMPCMESAGKQAYKQQYGSNSQHQWYRFSAVFCLLNDDRLASCCKDKMMKL